MIWLAGTEGEPQSAPDGTEYYGPWYDHTVTVQSVTVDRDGGRIVLAEEMPGEGPYLNEAYAAWIEAAEAAKEDFFREHPDLTEIDWAQPAEEWREANPCPLTPEEISGLWEAYDESHPVSFDPFVNFAVLDENGASLRPWIPFLTGGARKGTAENTLFFTPTDDLASVTIVPLYYTGREATLTLSRDSRDPVRAENGDLSAALLGWTADTERDTVTVSFRIDGVRLLDSWSFRLTGADGTEPDIGLLYEEVPFTDPATGIVTTEVRVTGANWDPASLTGCRITLYVPYMDEARAVTVPLP